MTPVMPTLSPVISAYQATGQTPLMVRIWPHEQPLAHVVFLHGIISHGGWYETSAAWLAAQGCAVHFLERRGSGLNPLSRGDVEHWQTWTEDVAIYLKSLPADRPRILLGISWGGILATAVAVQHPGILSGLGLVCPGIVSRVGANGVQRMLLRLARRIGLQQPRVQVPLQDPTLFTQSVVHQQFIASDPLALRKITLRFAVNNLDLLHAATAAPQQVSVPSLLMLGELDPIIDNRGTREFVARFGNRQQTIIEYPGASHTLEFEDDPTPYFNDLAAWVERIASPAP